MSKLSEYRALSAMTDGERNRRPVYVVDISEKKNKNDKMQVGLTVKDGVGKETVTIFDTDKATLLAMYPFLETNPCVWLVISRKGEYFNAEKLIEENKLDMDFSELAELAVDDPMKFYDYILSIVDNASCQRVHNGYDPLNKLVRYVYETNKELLLKSSSAVQHHHTGIGGNILHTAEVVNLCDTLLNSALGKDVDKELLIAAAALHDVGKVVCYETGVLGDAKMTLEGYARGGHHYDSMRAVEEAAKLGNYDEERILILENIIASHHGALEYGDIAAPMTIEGYWLNFMDNLDAKHYEAKAELSKLKPGTFSQEKVYSLKTRLYRRSDQIF